MQLARLSSTDPLLERGFAKLAAARPESVADQIGYDEALAHRIMAGADVVAVPSRYEPCGLTQLYGLRCGTRPVVRAAGGLAATAVDTSEANLHADTATGFVFHRATEAALHEALGRAQQLFQQSSRCGHR